MATDLTFEQINSQSGKSIYFIDSVSGDLCKNISALTDDTYTDLSDSGVVEEFYKGLKLANETQTQINKTETVLLNSFGRPVFGTVITGNPSYQVVTVVLTVKIPLQENEVIGVS
jgi:hypothetical protein